MHFLSRSALTVAVLVGGVLSGCGFHLRGNIRLAPALAHVRVTSTEQGTNVLKTNIEDALKRSGAAIEENSGDGVAEVRMTGVGLTTNVGSVGANARVNEFVMAYHVDLEILDGLGKVLQAKQALELSRRFTFDQTQAIGTGAQQEQIRREMMRDMTQAVVRKIDALQRKLAQ
ncbi:MAG: LPS assembly lipoprotein LptE [Rudaea sp.]